MYLQNKDSFQLDKPAGWIYEPAGWIYEPAGWRATRCLTLLSHRDRPGRPGGVCPTFAEGGGMRRTIRIERQGEDERRDWRMKTYSLTPVDPERGRRI